MSNRPFLDQLFGFCLKNRNRIIFLFKLWYGLLIILLLIGGRSLYYLDTYSATFYTLGTDCGRLALIFYILTTIPGITKRFGLQHRLIQIILLFRRYLGISVYMLLIVHFSFMELIPSVLKGFFRFPPPLFELFGITAATLLFFMFITSNDISTKLLGKWWWILHKVTYAIIWLIFFHVLLQRVSIWSVLIGITAVLQVGSHIYSRRINQQSTQVPVV